MRRLISDPCFFGHWIVKMPEKVDSICVRVSEVGAHPPAPDLASNGSISAFRTGFDQFDFYVSGMMHSGAQERMLLEETAQDTLLSDIATDLAAGVPELAVLVEQMLAPSSADPSDVSISLINNRAHNLRFLLQRSRHFNLELFPRLVYSSGSVIELLLASGVNNYLEFKALESAAVKWDGVIKTVSR